MINLKYGIVAGLGILILIGTISTLMPQKVVYAAEDSSDESGTGDGSSGSQQGNSNSGGDDPAGQIIAKGALKLGCYAILKTPQCLALSAQAGN
jgi:hypothetical protein